MELIRDRETETSPQYTMAMIQVLPILEEELARKKISANNYWERKKELLKKYGVDWKTPYELNFKYKTKGGI